MLEGLCTVAVEIQEDIRDMQAYLGMLCVVGVVGVVGGVRAMEGGIILETDRSDDKEVVRSRIKGEQEDDEEVLIRRGYDPVIGGGGGKELRLKCSCPSSLLSAEGTSV